MRKATKLAGFALLFLITSSLLFPLTINFSLAEAGTTVSVQITSDTVWTKANSPYIFTEGVLVLEGVTLTIEPSVVVKFECSYGLAVYGQLIARGTESEPIVFISAWGNWAGISFMDTSTDASYNEEGNYLSGSIMQYCTINYTWEGDQDVSVLQIEKSSPFIDHSNIIMPPARELPLSVTPSRRGIVVHKGSPRITNSRITNGGISVYNSVKGLHEPIETEVTIQGNIIENNKQSYGAGIDIWDSIVVIKGNVITNNRAYHPHGPGGGIWIQGVGKAIITENIISGNSAEKGGGIRISSDNVTLSGNIITSNTAIYGGGICVSGASPMIYGNIISDNLGSGVFIWGGNPTLKYNNITDNDSGYGGIYIWRGKALINYNNIYGNTWYDVVNHDAQNPSDIDATNNWWGTTEESIIQTHIYDWYDDKSLGLVIFKPYLTSLFIEWTFAIITDLHIGRGYSDYGGVGWNDLGTGGQNYYLTDRLNRTVNWIIENRENHHIRFVIVLGDIADSAEYSEFDKAKVILSRLDDPDGDPNTNDAIPYVPVIGNHDVWPYTEDEEADWPEADRYFRKIFIEERLGLLSSYFENWESPDITEEITWGFPFKRWTAHLQNYAFKYRGIKFVCLDFVTRIPTPFGLGVGSDAVLHPNTTKWLKDHLVESEPTILFSHHPLVWNPTLAFEGYELINIADVIRNSHVDVKAHFAGHIHGFNRFAFQLDVFMDANHEYEFMNFNSTTTEALMVGGNELKAGGVKGIIRIVEVYGKDIWYEPNRAEGDFPSLNPYLYLQSAKRREVGEVVKFEISPFQKGRTFKYRLEWGEDNTKAEGQSSTDALVTHSYEKHGNYLVNLTVWDANDPSLVEYITRNVLVEDVGEVWNPYGITCSESTVPILWNGANVAENPQNTPEYVTLLVKHSEPIPVASLMVHFENATGNIDLTSAIVDANLEERKSIIYMPSWPDVIELSKVLYIPSTGKGAVYICKNAKTLDEVNFINADIVISVGETKDGMTLSTTIYNGVEYYVVFNITGTGGGEIDNIPPEIGKLVQEPSEDIMAYQNVTVTVNVTDLGTGIFNVTLWYSIDNGTPWILLNMNEVSPDIYQATIPGYDDGIWVTYKIVAYDNTGNSAVKDNNGYYYKYHVIPEFTSAIILPLFILTTLTATVLLKKKRRMKPQLP